MEHNVPYTPELHGPLDTGQFITGFVLTGLFCLFGLVVNVCVYLVVLQIKVLCRYMWYLLTLTFFDWLICFTAIFHLVIPSYCSYFQCTTLDAFLSNHASLRIAVEYIYSTLQCTEIWITVALTYDRFWLISQPIESGSLFDKRRTKKTVCIVPILAVLYNIPKLVFMCYYGKDSDSTWQNETSTSSEALNTSARLQWESTSNDLCGNTTQEWNLKKGYCLIYGVVCNWLFLHILPTLALCIYNFKLYMKVRIAKRHLCQISTLKTKKKDTLWATINVIALVIVFIICQTPSFVYKVCTYVNITKASGIWYQVTELILVINSAVNFVVYFLIFGLFRRLAKSFFCGNSTGMEPNDRVSKTCNSNTFARRQMPVRVTRPSYKSIHSSSSVSDQTGKVTHV